MNLLLVVSLAAQDPQVVTVQPMPPVTEAAVEVAAPLPLRVVRPVETQSEAGLAVGHTGSVFIEVDVQPDGTRGEVIVAETSRSTILDAEAVELISGATLRGQSLPMRFRVEVKFEPYNFVEMTCRSFALQARWFQQTWPEKSIKDTTLYTASVGLVTLVAMNNGAGTTQTLRGAREMEAAWPRLIAECERQPDRAYVQVLARLMS